MTTDACRFRSRTTVVGRVRGLTLACVLALSACGSAAGGLAADEATSQSAMLDENDETAAQETISGTAMPVTPSDNPSGSAPSNEVLPSGAAGMENAGNHLALEGMRTRWEGTIGADTAVEIWLVQEGDVVRGEITYVRVGEPITLLGTRVTDGDWYTLQEFNPEGRVSGYLTLGSVENGVVSDATWGDQPLALTYLSSDIDTEALEPVIRPGAYTAAHPPFLKEGEECCGPTDRLTITSVTTTSLTIEIDNVTGGPAFNLALVDPTVIPLVGNRASFILDEPSFDCAFDVVIFDGFARVDYVDDRFNCGFGNAAGVEGNYLLTEPYVAAEDSPFASATLDFERFGPIALGDSWESLTERFGIRAHDQDLDDTLFGECSYVHIENDPLSPWLMMLGSGEQSVVSRIEIADRSARTEKGVGVGSTKADVIAAYAGQISALPHHYLGTGAEYLTVTVPKGETRDTTILFETDEEGIITSMRNGFNDPIAWIEGCA